jgi:hypothetical protein
MEVQMKTFTTSCLVVFLACPLLQARKPQAEKVNESQTETRHEQFVGVIEKVIKAEDDGFVSNSYLVAWRGKQIVVQDPIHQSELKVGENVRFLAVWISMPTKNGTRKLLSFTVL